MIKELLDWFGGTGVKLISLDYYNPKQRDAISDRVLKDGDCVKFYSKVLGGEVHIAPDKEKKEALLKTKSIYPHWVYLPDELREISNYSPKELSDHHANRALIASGSPRNDLFSEDEE